MMLPAGLLSRSSATCGVTCLSEARCKGSAARDTSPGSASKRTCTLVTDPRRPPCSSVWTPSTTARWCCACSGYQSQMTRPLTPSTSRPERSTRQMTQAGQSHLPAGTQSRGVGKHLDKG
eukprot:scaffold8224_cov61-Phaeocystis_antarctica.AAC.2